MQTLFPTRQEIVLAVDTPQKESDSKYQFAHLQIRVIEVVGFVTSYISSSVHGSQLRRAAALHTLTSTVPPVV